MGGCIRVAELERSGRNAGDAVDRADAQDAIIDEVDRTRADARRQRRNIVRRAGETERATRTEKIEAKPGGRDRAGRRCRAGRAQHEQPARAGDQDRSG